MHVDLHKDWTPLRIVPPNKHFGQLGYATQTVVRGWFENQARALLQFAPLVFDPPVIAFWQIKKMTGVKPPRWMHWKEATKVDRMYWYPAAVDINVGMGLVYATHNLFDQIYLSDGYV